MLDYVSITVSSYVLVNDNGKPAIGIEVPAILVAGDPGDISTLRGLQSRENTLATEPESGLTFEVDFFQPFPWPVSARTGARYSVPEHCKPYLQNVYKRGAGIPATVHPNPDVEQQHHGLLHNPDCPFAAAPAHQRTGDTIYSG